MSTIEDPHPAMVQAAWSAVGSVPGCAFTGLRFNNAASFRSPFRSMTASFTGWSPSLHRVDVDQHVPMDMGPHVHKTLEQAQADTLARTLTDALGRQLQRAQRALALGIAAPLAIDEDRIRIDHLQADASLLAHAIQEGAGRGHPPDMALRAQLSRPLSMLHRRTPPHHGRSDHAVREIGVDDATDPPTVEFLQQSPRAELPLTGWQLMGNRLMIGDRPIPETAAAAAIGHPLSRVAETDRLLGPRRILDVDMTDGRVNIILRPLPVPLGDVIRLGAWEALELLRRIIDDDAGRN